MEHVVSDGAVIKVTWQCLCQNVTGQGLSETYVNAYAVNGGEMMFNPDPLSPSYIPYDQLTQDEVLGWVWTAMGAEEKAAIEATLQAKVQAQLNPTVEGGLPWAAPSA
jgi:hypothetical protein